MSLPSFPCPGTLQRVITGFVIFLTTCLAGAYDISLHVDYDKSRGVEIEMTAAYENNVPTGFMPVQIRISNHSGRAREYLLSTQPEYYGMADYQIAFSSKLRVDNQTTKVFSIYVPVSNLDDHTYYYPQMLSLEGFAITPGSSIPMPNLLGSTSGKTRTGYILVDKDISVVSWEPTRQWLDSTGQQLWGSAITPESVPRDMTGLIGVNLFWLSAQNWAKLSPESREAVKEWVMQGGHLFLATPDPAAYRNEDLNISGATMPGKTLDKWLGSVTVLPWDGTSNLLQACLENPEIKTRLMAHQLNLQIARGYQAQGQPPGFWPLLMEMPDARAVGVFIMIFMVLFAIVVGPVNLFVFAKDPFRYRLFWTTPLISIVTSVLLFILILLKDGVGASGQALTLVYLAPEENRQVRIQEQCTLSGLLVKRNFTLQQPVFLAAPRVDDSRKKLTMDIHGGGQYSGDWFASRSVNALLFIKSEPTRARVEVVNRPPFGTGNPPQIVSSLETPMQEIYFVDSQGNFWNAPGVTAGQKIKLSPATKENFQAFIQVLNEKSGSRIKSLIHHHFQAGVKNHFYARPVQPQKELIPTLSSIRWKSADAYFVGAVAGADTLESIPFPSNTSLPAETATDSATTTKETGTQTP